LLWIAVFGQVLASVHQVERPLQGRVRSSDIIGFG
jgi:hypothetical protein